MRQLRGSSLSEVMACDLYGAKQLFEPMMTYCQLSIYDSLRWNLNHNKEIFVHENAFENYAKMTAVLFRPQYVQIQGIRLAIWCELEVMIRISQ